MIPQNHYTEAAAFINAKMPYKAKIAIILGSGLGELASKIEEPTVIPYTQIPHFAASTAIGHKGNLIVGKLGGKAVIALQGRKQRERTLSISMGFVY